MDDGNWNLKAFLGLYYSQKVPSLYGDLQKFRGY